MTNKCRAGRIALVLIDDEWWIEGHDPVMGPYDTKGEAMEDLRGVKNFYLREAPTDKEADALEDILS